MVVVGWLVDGQALVHRVFKESLYSHRDIFAQVAAQQRKSNQKSAAVVTTSGGSGGDDAVSTPRVRIIYIACS